jgi:hypothetical protein
VECKGSDVSDAESLSSSEHRQENRSCDDPGIFCNRGSTPLHGRSGAKDCHRQERATCHLCHPTGAHLRWTREFETFPEYWCRHVTSRAASTRRRVSRRHLNFYRPQAPKNSELTPRLRRIKQKLASTQAPFPIVQDTHRSASISIISSTTLSSFVCRNCVEHGASQGRVERL